jgi:hypothetical protein
MSRNYIENLKRAAVQAGIIVDLDQQSDIHTDKYVMGLGLLTEFIERATLPVPEVLKEFRRLNPDLKKPAAEDAAEESQMVIAEDLSCEDQDEETAPLHAEIVDEAGGAEIDMTQESRRCYRHYETREGTDPPSVSVNV